MNSRNLGLRLGEIEDLPRVEVPEELLHDLRALVAPAPRVDEDEEWLQGWRGYRLDDEGLELVFLAVSLLERELLFPAHRGLEVALVDLGTV